MKGDKGAVDLQQVPRFFCAMAKDREPEKEKTTYKKIIDGELEPVGSQKGWINLEKRTSFNMMEPERAKEIQRMGAEAVNALKGEKRTAKESLENILTMKASEKIINAADLSPELAERLKRSGIDITMYDLMQLVAVGRAVGGNMKAYELIRDTYGDMPIKQIEVSENITTDQDREMLRTIAERLKNAETVQIVESVDTTIKDDPE
jgi:isopentenyl diphosphate isomerase/L-lactate dehydrogenase-like FMN-dependent dehydrogenase